MKSDKKRKRRTGSFWNFEDKKKLEEERNSFCCNVCLPLVSHSCHKKDQLLVPNLILRKLSLADNVYTPSLSFRPSQCSGKNILITHKYWNIAAVIFLAINKT